MDSTIEKVGIRLRERVIVAFVLVAFATSCIFIWSLPDGSASSAAVRAADSGPAVHLSHKASATPAASTSGGAPETVKVTVPGPTKVVHDTTVVKEQPMVTVVHPVSGITKTVTASPKTITKTVTKTVKVTTPAKATTAAPKPAAATTSTKPTAVAVAHYAPSVTQLEHPSLRYDGISTPQAPFDNKEVSIFSGLTGSNPNLVMWFQGWDQPFNPSPFQTAWANGQMPLLTWDPKASDTPTGPQDGTGTQAPVDYSLQSIVNGNFDSYLTTWATAAAALKLPFALRFAHEMNGNWNSWSAITNGNNPALFVAAWKHVHDIFTAASATNVIWVWAPNINNWCGTCISTHSTPYASLYPGDNYVDWVGLTGYYRSPVVGTGGVYQTPSFSNTFQSSLTELRAAAPGKPILLAEVGAQETPLSSLNPYSLKQQWISSVFAGIAQNPDIIGLVWFDQSIQGRDWRVESSQSSVTAYKAGAGTGLYASPFSPADTASPSGTAAPSVSITALPSTIDSPTASPGASPTPSASPSATASPTASPSASLSPTPTPTPSASSTTPHVVVQPARKKSVSSAPARTASRRVASGTPMVSA